MSFGTSAVLRLRLDCARPPRFEVGVLDHPQFPGSRVLTRTFIIFRIRTSGLSQIIALLREHHYHSFGCDLYLCKYNLAQVHISWHVHRALD